MNLSQVMKELSSMGSEQTKKNWMKHGAREPFYGVKVGDLKKVVKKIKKNHELSLELFDTGNSDAMYLAALIADENKISRRHLQKWVRKANWYMLSEYSVPWVASESKHGWNLAVEWIASDKEKIASAGWSTLSNYISIQPDDELPIDKLEKLLDLVEAQIHSAANRVRYTMNGFVIATAIFVPTLHEKAVSVAKKIGKVTVDMGGTACKVPVAVDYIDKAIKAGRLGRKRKMARC
ncbi:MAG: DNA alkylation repair protein [Saprospiraceae bacterium]|nr:DNA alkylation repair protein [Saprospiraceae bacterium]